MKSILLVFLLIWVLSLMQSCTVYMPQTASIPLMSEVGELQLSAGGTNLLGACASVAYAPAEHFAIQAYGSTYFGDINYAQACMGYFTKTKLNSNFEIYGGVGTGNGSELFNSENLNREGKYMLYFAQANFGKTNQGNAHMDYGLGLKSGMFEAKIFDHKQSSIPYINHSLMIEPQAFIRLGTDRFKVGFQVNGLWIQNLSKESYHDILFYPLNLGVNLSYRFSTTQKATK